MGFLDDAKNLADKAEDAAADHKDTIKDGVDKAGDMVKDKVGQLHSPRSNLQLFDLRILSGLMAAIPNIPM